MARTYGSDAQRAAQKKYLAKFKEIKLRFLPEEYDAIVEHAFDAGDRSTTSFMIRAIRETMEREKKE